jgi:hypothetical protein
MPLDHRRAIRSLPAGGNGVGLCLGRLGHEAGSAPRTYGHASAGHDRRNVGLRPYHVVRAER